MWAFLRTWDGGNIHLVVIGVLDRFEIDGTRKLCTVRSVVKAVDRSTSAVAISGLSHILAETYVEYLGNGYKKRLAEYPIFDLRLLNRCLREVVSSVFGYLDPLSKTEFINNHLKGAQHRGWMMWRSSLRRAIITNVLQMPSMVEFVANIVGMATHRVPPQENGRKD